MNTNREKATTASKNERTTKVELIEPYGRRRKARIFQKRFPRKKQLFRLYTTLFEYTSGAVSIAAKKHTLAVAPIETRTLLPMGMFASNTEREKVS